MHWHRIKQPQVGDTIRTNYTNEVRPITKVLHKRAGLWLVEYEFPDESVYPPGTRAARTVTFVTWWAAGSQWFEVAGESLPRLFPLWPSTEAWVLRAVAFAAGIGMGLLLR